MFLHPYYQTIDDLMMLRLYQWHMFRFIVASEALSDKNKWGKCLEWAGDVGRWKMVQKYCTSPSI